MAVNIPLDIKIRNNIAMFTRKHLVISIIRCFFYPHTKLINFSNINKNENFEYSLNNNKLVIVDLVWGCIFCLIFIGFSRSFILACDCEKNIINYKKLYGKQSSTLNKLEFKGSVKVKEIKPVIVIKPQVIYPEEYKSKKFVGAEKCKLCHSVEYRKWQKTKHAQAYIDMNKHYEEEKNANRKHKIERTDCESCHTTGYGYKFGFILGSSSDKLTNVQCEICHGPGEDHVKNYKQKMVFGENPIPEALCRNCHCEEIAPGFKYVEYLGKINCITKHKND
jgi:hypothetical protein